MTRRALCFLKEAQVRSNFLKDKNAPEGWASAFQKLEVVVFHWGYSQTRESHPHAANTQNKFAFSPSVPLSFFVLSAFGARYAFDICNPSRVRIKFLCMLVLNVLLALRFFTSGIVSQLVDYALANCNNKLHMILTIFLRTRFYNAMSLPPKPQHYFLFICYDCVGSKMSFPR